MSLPVLHGEVLPPDASARPAAPAVQDDAGRLSVADLVRMFEDSESATADARGEAETDRDYYDNKQLSAQELAALRKRGQPETIINFIALKVDTLVGIEKDRRIDPKALPRTPQHEEDADGASQGLRYVADQQDYDTKRSGVWRNLLIEGAGGIGVAVEEKAYGICITLQRVPWDRMFWDPHSAALDFSDASYLGVVTWMDYADALAKYPDGAEILDATISSAASSDTYDDKPKFAMWADRARRRVRVVQVWIRRDDAWHFAEYTKGGILKAGPSPYVDEHGNPDCELVFQSTKADRDNNRYGVVRAMRSLQDSVNKRHSKSLHLLNTNQVLYEDGAIDDIERFRREAARPDGTLKVSPGYMDKVKIETRTDLATAHFQLLQHAETTLDRFGGNIALQGDALNNSSASGKAIIASQQGGMLELGDLLDSLAHLDKRVFRAVWNRIRQFWTAEKWVRVTDDERNVKWLGFNVDRGQLQQMAAQDPEAAKRIAGVVGNVAELDVDIIIDEAPDGTTPALEQFQTLAELAKSGLMTKTGRPIPIEVLIKAAPNLRNKSELIDYLEGKDESGQADLHAQQQQFQQHAQQVQMQLEMQQKAADLTKREAAVVAKEGMAKAHELLGGMQQQGEPAPDPSIPLEEQVRHAQETLATQKDKVQVELDKRAVEVAKRELELRAKEIALQEHTAAAQAQMQGEPQEPVDPLEPMRMETEAIKAHAAHAQAQLQLRQAQTETQGADDAEASQAEEAAALQAIQQQMAEESQKIDAVLQAVQQLIAIASAPNRVVYHPETGRPIGSEKVMPAQSDAAVLANASAPGGP